MNTGKQINAMVIVLFLTLIAVGAYSIWDPFRSESAEDEQLKLAVERAATTFALNCRLCHGDRGQGGAAGGRLPAALPLDNESLQGIDMGAFSQAEFDADLRFVVNTITCGRVGTAMPVWGDTQGGTLNEEQVRQLAVLITEARWDVAQEHADELDAETTGHATVEMPGGSFAVDETELVVSNAGPFSAGQYVRIKIDEENEERLRILPRQLEVERGVEGTEPAAHDSGTTVLLGDGQETGQALAEPMDEEGTALVVPGPDAFTPGQTLQLEDERVRVVGSATGLPTTGQRLAREIGRTAERFLVSGSEGIEVGLVARIDGELMEVRAVRDDGDAGIVLGAGVSAADQVIAVSDAAFFPDPGRDDRGRPERARRGQRYVVRVEDELIEVLGPVDTRLNLAETVGRAETAFAVSGTEGIEVGMVIRVGEELTRVMEIVTPARIDVGRAAPDSEGSATQAAPHAAGTAILRLVQGAEEADEDEELEPQFEPTDQTLLEAVNDSTTTFVVGGTTGVSPGQTYRLGDELVVVSDVQPARIRVERAVDGTELAGHGRRAPIYEGNLIEVERGVDGTSVAAHGEGAEVFLTALEVKRGVGGSPLEDHSKNAELYLGNRLVVERAVFETQPANHPNGALVLDFPTAPSDPAILMETCGQVSAGPATGPQPTVAGAIEVAVSLAEWSVTPDAASVAAGPVTFVVNNDGTALHNFRVIATDLAADALPVADGRVDEGQVDVVGGFAEGLPAGQERNAPAELAAASYVLICNVPGHYEQGMFVAFQVTAP